MADLKTLKLRIKSVKSTQKITKAMKVVSAAKLRRVKEQLDSSIPYHAYFNEVLQEVLNSGNLEDVTSPLMLGHSTNTHLLVVMTSDKGLCGSFNAAILKLARKQLQSLEAEGKKVSILCVGKKGYEQMRSYARSKILNHYEFSNKKTPFEAAIEITSLVMDTYLSQRFHACSIIYSKFRTALSQEPQNQEILPIRHNPSLEIKTASIETEPDADEFITYLIPESVKINIYHALLENAASEQGARMTAMENATKNAGEMIKKLTLKYNRSRQAAITKELIEIISGAEAI